MRAGNNFLRIIASGIALFLLTQATMNIGMNVGLLPVTGITLPFVSYGGSSLLTFFAALGIVQGVYASGMGPVETNPSFPGPYE
jgi:rod shape determining protein RodA